jgi:hypothetical protein
MTAAEADRICDMISEAVKKCLVTAPSLLPII